MQRESLSFFSYLQTLLVGIFLVVFLTGSSLSYASGTPLPANEAFAFRVDSTNPKEIFIHWDIAPGYYLYKERLNVTVLPKNKVTNISTPQGEFRYDAEQGRTEVFYNSLEVVVKLKSQINSGQLIVDYQGCSAGGFCYPPMHQSITLGEPITGMEALPIATSERLPDLLTDQNSIQSVFGNHNLFVTLLIFAGIGLLLAFTPCVLPMIPILTGIIIGQKGRVSTKVAFMLSLVYVLGSSITYALAGLAAASMGSTLQAALQTPTVIIITSFLFVLLALSLFGLYHLRLPNFMQQRLHHMTHRQEGGSYAGVFVMGIISTLIVSPCVTAPLVGVLIYIGETGDRLLGFAALFCMGIGMGIPLLLIGMSAGKLLPKSGPWMIAIKEMFGMLLLGMAIWLLSRILPFFITKLLWIFLIAGALAYIVYGITRAKRLHRKWAYTLGVAAGLMSLVLIAGNMRDLLHTVRPNLMANNFVVVRSVADLNKQLEQAHKEKKLALVDFYADWCESCVEMDKTVFDKPHVQEALKNYILIRADLTANNNDEEKLMQKYAVFAPPAVLFFDKVGQENRLHRINGEVGVKEFLSRLTTFEMASCNNKINC